MSSWQYLAVVRHGQSEANKGLELSSCGFFYSLCGSDRSVALTELGERQAAEVGELLARLFPRKRRICRLLDNRFLRVKQTADLIADALGYPLERLTHPGLEKRNYGRFWNLTHRGVEVLHRDEWQRYKSEGDMFYRPPDGGENYPDVFARVDATIEAELERSRFSNQVVVTSSLVALCFRRRYEGLSDTEVLRLYEETAIANAAVLIYSRRSPDERWSPCHAEMLVA